MKDHFRTITLAEFSKTHTQQQIAGLLGITQGAVHQMLRKEREIYVVVNDHDIAIQVYEIKRLLK